MENLPERIKQLRGYMSRRSFAKMIGLPEGTIRNYEHGTSQPKFDALCQISQKLRVSLDWLVFGAGECSEAQPISSGACQQCAELQRQLAVANERLYEAMRENGDLKEANGALYAELVVLKNKQSHSENGQTPTASAS